MPKRNSPEDEDKDKDQGQKDKKSNSKEGPKFKKQKTALGSIQALPEKQFNALNFNASSKNPQHQDYGVPVSFYACLLAMRGEPALLNRILALPQEQFKVLNFNAGPENRQHLNYGMSVLYLAYDLAMKGKPALLNSILALPEEQFNALNFNAGCKNPQHPCYGVPVSFYACLLAMKGEPALLNRILALPQEQFKVLNFNAGSKNPQHPNYGMSVLYLAHKMAMKEKPALLNSILALPQEQFRALNFNACPKNRQHPSYGKSVLYGLCLGEKRPPIFDKMCERILLDVSNQVFSKLDFSRILKFFQRAVRRSNARNAMKLSILRLIVRNFGFQGKPEFIGLYNFLFVFSRDAGQLLILLLSMILQAKIPIESIDKIISLNQKTLEVYEYLKKCKELYELINNLLKREFIDPNGMKRIDKLIKYFENKLRLNTNNQLKGDFYFMIGNRFKPSALAHKYYAKVPKASEKYIQVLEEILGYYFAAKTDTLPGRLANLKLALQYALKLEMMQSNDSTHFRVLQIAEMYLKTNEDNFKKNNVAQFPFRFFNSNEASKGKEKVDMPSSSHSSTISDTQWISRYFYTGITEQVISAICSALDQQRNGIEMHRMLEKYSQTFKEGRSEDRENMLNTAAATPAKSTLGS